MTFKTLPKWIQAEIAAYTFDTETKLENLTASQWATLSAKTPAELFESWLIWTGIIGYTTQIMDVHQAIFGNTESSFEAPIILKLYTGTGGGSLEEDSYISRVGFPSASSAESFVKEWEDSGNSVAWVKC